MWKRFLQGWSAYRHAAALKSLLEALGLWKYVALAGATVIAVVLAWASGLPTWLAVLLALLVVAIVLFIVGLAFAMVRIAQNSTQPSTPQQKEVGDLTNCPKVVLSHGATGINLIVEALNEDAANVQLVRIRSHNYELGSEVIRHLRKGRTQPLVLWCRQDTAQSGILRQFSAPRLFFEDLYPQLNGNPREMLEQSLTQLTEQQIAVDCGLAYSSVSVAEHFRSSFKIRFENLPASLSMSNQRGCIGIITRHRHNRTT